MNASAESNWPSARAGWYATLILTLAYTFSFVDRQVLKVREVGEARRQSRELVLVKVQFHQRALQLHDVDW